MRIEETILANLIENETFSRRVIPYIKAEYFVEAEDKLVFNLINHYITKYSSIPSKEALYIDIEKIPKLNENTYNKSKELIDKLKTTPVDEKWLIENTESFCKERSVYNAIMKAIRIYDDKEGKEKEGIEALPSILSDALSVSFDQNIGHDYLENFDERWEYYNRKDSKIPFNITMLDTITEGGLSLKTLSVALAGIHVGKSLMMCSMAANNMMQGNDVLYITLELSEEMVGQRIDANLLNVSLKELKKFPKDTYIEKSKAVRKKALGNLIIKEYPPASVSTIHFKHFIQELKLKKKFIPKIIYVDYINLMVSSRIKNGQGINSYSIIKSIAEELRALAIEMNVPVFTATQLTRGGSTQSDVGMEDTSESFGLPATADLFISVVQTEELKESNKYLIKQLKNRMSDVSTNTRFVIGVDKARMRLFDTEQGDIIHEEPKQEYKQPFSKPKIDKKKFSDFK